VLFSGFLGAASALLCGCSAAGVSQEQISPSSSGPLPLSEAEKTCIGMIEDNYDSIAELNANVMAVVLKTRPLPDELISQLNKTLKAKAKVVLFWDDFEYPSQRLSPVRKAWNKVRNDDITFTTKFVTFVNDSSSDKKMEAAVHALAIMGTDWRRCKATIKELKAEAAGQTKSASPSP
jgi:hypothetical protein